MRVSAVHLPHLGEAQSSWQLMLFDQFFPVETNVMLSDVTQRPVCSEWRGYVLQGDTA